MIVGLDYSCRDFYLLEVNSIRLSESEGNSDYFSKMLVTSASMALEHFYLSIKDSSHKVGTSEIYCFNKEELEEIKQFIETSEDVISYNLTSITSVFLYGTDDYIHLYNKINVGIDAPNFYIINNFLKIHATPKSVNQKVENVGLDFLFPVEKEIYNVHDFIPSITCLQSDKLLLGTFKPRIYYYTIDILDKTAWEKISNLLKITTRDTSYYHNFECDKCYEEICEESDGIEKGVYVTLPANIEIIEAAFSFLNVGCFKYQIKDITDNILFHSDVPGIYLNKFNSDEGFYNSVNGVIEELVDIDSITTYYADATANGCTSSTRASVIATINAVPIITSTTDGSRCGPGEVALSAISSSGSINWFETLVGGLNIATGGAFVTPNLSASTNYFVEGFDGTCKSISRTLVKATINSQPTAVLISGMTTGLKINNTYSYISNQQSNVIYTWSVTNGIIVSGQGTNTVDIKWVTAGATKLSLIVENSSGCRDSSFLNLIVAANTPLIISFNPQSGTNGSVITIIGEHFTGTTGIKFGGTKAKSFNIVSNTKKTLIFIANT